MGARGAWDSRGPRARPRSTWLRKELGRAVSLRGMAVSSTSLPSRRILAQVPSGAESDGNQPRPVLVTATKDWCGGPESNRHSPCGPRDFKSRQGHSARSRANWQGNARLASEPHEYWVLL